MPERLHFCGTDQLQSSEPSSDDYSYVEFYNKLCDNNSDNSLFKTKIIIISDNKLYFLRNRLIIIIKAQSYQVMIIEDNW